MKFLKDILFIFLVSSLFTGLTAGVNQVLSHRIELNQQTRFSRQLLDVLDITYPANSRPGQIAAIEKQRVASQTIDGKKVYRSVDESGNPQGYAFEVAGKGLWGKITGLMSLDDDMQHIKGLIFTSHSETPGLGARIDERWFLDQFKGIDIKSYGDKHKRNFVRISSQDSAETNRVDGITGATITTSSVERFLNDGIRDILELQDKIRRATWRSPPRK